MDSTAAEFEPRANGTCNFCGDFMDHVSTLKSNVQSYDRSLLAPVVEQIKKEGKGKKYDCIVGVSGGVDSSYVLYLTKELGLRPLAVHMDNGWNSDLAQSNIENVVNSCNVDLYTHVIDWAEYRQLMQAFFDADVIDVELLYDNAMYAVNYNLCKKYGLKWILGGMNTATEGMPLPSNWCWFKFDKTNIKNIAKRSGISKLTTFPAIGIYDVLINKYIRKIKFFSLLDYVPYERDDVLKTLVDELNYRPYPFKHYESVFTRFFQGFLLPKKFNVDKRKLHLSNLYLTGQISKADALLALDDIAYESERQLEEDKKYFLKKMKWTPETLNDYLSRPEVPHSTYGTDLTAWNRLIKIKRMFR